MLTDQREQAATRWLRMGTTFAGVGNPMAITATLPRLGAEKAPKTYCSDTLSAAAFFGPVRCVQSRWSGKTVPFQSVCGVAGRDLLRRQIVLHAFHPGDRILEQDLHADARNSIVFSIWCCANFKTE